MATETLRYNIVLNEQVSAGLAKIEARLASLESHFDRTNATASSMNGLMKGSFMLNAASTVANIAQQVWGMASAYVDAAGSLQANMNAIKVASGSSAEFAKNEQFLLSLTDKMPISLAAAIEGYKTWSGAIMETSLSGDTGRKIFEQVSTAVAAMGLTADDAKGIFLAMGQMVSKGTVQAEELKGQLGERLPGAFLLAAKSMNVTTSELGNLMKDGKVAADVLLPHLGDQLSGRFGEAAKNAGNSINGLMIKLENLKTRGLMEVTPYIQAFLKGIVDISTYVSNLDFEPLMDVFRPYIATVQELFTIYERLFGSIGGGNIILKVLATLLQTTLVPFQILTGYVQFLAESFFTLYDAISLVASGELSKAGDRIVEGASKIGDIGSNTIDRSFGAYGDIWTESDLHKKQTAIEEATKGIDFSFLDKKSTAANQTAGSASTAKELEKASSSISGSAPRSVTIQINSLVGQNNNYISNVQDPYKDLSTFMEKFKQALQQEVIDISIQGI